MKIILDSVHYCADVRGLLNTYPEIKDLNFTIEHICKPGIEKDYLFVEFNTFEELINFQIKLGIDLIVNKNGVLIYDAPIY